MDQIFYVNSASFVEVSISSSLIAAAGSNIDLSQAAIVSGSFSGTFQGNASTATTASYALTTAIALSATSASYASTASVSVIAISSSHAQTALSAETASHIPSLPKIKSGKISGSLFGGNPRTASVVFSMPYTNTNYAVSIIGGDARQWTLEQVSASGFTISTNSKMPLADYVYWTAIGSGESM